MITHLTIGKPYSLHGNTNQTPSSLNILSYHPCINTIRTPFHASVEYFISRLPNPPVIIFYICHPPNSLSLPNGSPHWSKLLLVMDTARMIELLRLMDWVNWRVLWLEKGVLPIPGRGVLLGRANERMARCGLSIVQNWNPFGLVVFRLATFTSLNCTIYRLFRPFTWVWTAFIMLPLSH